MTTLLLSYRGRVKYALILKIGIQMTNTLRLSNSKVPSKVNCHLLMPYKVNDVTKRALRGDNDSLTLMVPYREPGRILFRILQLVFSSQ